MLTQHYSPSMRTIGTVEGFLILSEWPPGASLIGDKLGLGGLPPTRESSACKVLDDVGWMMTGMVSRDKVMLALRTALLNTCRQLGSPRACH